MVLAIKNMGGESEAAWRAVLDELLARGMAKPELVIVDGGKGCPPSAPVRQIEGFRERRNSGSS
jgi:transposase-like protein